MARFDVTDLEGCTLQSVTRKGKDIIFTFDDGSAVMMPEDTLYDINGMIVDTQNVEDDPNPEDIGLGPDEPEDEDEEDEDEEDEDEEE